MLGRSINSSIYGLQQFDIRHLSHAILPISCMMRMPPNISLLHPFQYLDTRLAAVSDALRIASIETHTTCKYNSECLVRQANQGIIEVGDSILVKAQEALSLSSK